MESEKQGPLTRDIKSLPVAYVLCAIVLLDFAIQVAGISMTDRDLKPIFPPSRILEGISEFGITIAAMGPFLSLGALSIVRSANAGIVSRKKKILVWAVAVFTVIVSFAGWLWTCGGHPTWVQGYP